MCTIVYFGHFIVFYWNRFKIEEDTNVTLNIILMPKTHIYKLRTIFIINKKYIILLINIQEVINTNTRIT
ncbi:hypothetical protein D4764_0180870 [Takifugu flavidus]|uniref:Uncharacterized protein n=1 Tax=Takifugu flavidus TaxID=433684 RepID=A0A5C6MEI9_9TELE|nr:hypothetical protein D4764_0180870 [Takifugu flavidus]